MESTPATPPASPRARLAVVAGALALLAIVVIGATLGGGGEESSAFAPPEACIEDWNADAGAVGVGRHNVSLHAYNVAQVGYLTVGDELSPDPAGGACAVLFGGGELGVDHSSSAQVRDEGGWSPLYERLAPARLSVLQSRVNALANVDVAPDGVLAAQR